MTKERSELAIKQTDQLRGQLDERYIVLVQAIRDELLESGDEQLSELAGRVHDTKDESFAELISEVAVGRVKLHAAELNDIDRARQRIEAGNYGQCLECSETIGYERLGAYPTAMRCISCQTAFELPA